MGISLGITFWCYVSKIIPTHPTHPSMSGWVYPIPIATSYSSQHCTPIWSYKFKIEYHHVYGSTTNRYVLAQRHDFRTWAWPVHWFLSSLHIQYRHKTIGNQSKVMMPQKWFYSIYGSNILLFGATYLKKVHKHTNWLIIALGSWDMGFWSSN